MNLNTVNVICVIVCFTQGIEIAKEVEGGVQLLGIGKIELTLPERLSFTVKRLHQSQKCVGTFIICYEVTSTKGNFEGKKKYFVNYWQACPPGTCVLAVNPQSVYGLTMEDNDDHIYAFFNDDSVLACPRKVENNRETFTVKELPDCPVFVNDARLPKDDKEVTSEASTMKWVIIACVFVVLIIIGVVVAFCVFMQCRDKPAAVKYDGDNQHVPKSVVSPAKQSPMNTLVEP